MAYICDVIAAVCTEGDIGAAAPTNPMVEPVEIESRSFHPFYEWRKKSHRGQRGPSCHRDRQRKAALRFKVHGKRSKAPRYSIEIFGELDLKTMEYRHKTGDSQCIEDIANSLVFLGIDFTIGQWEELERTGELGIKTDKVFILIKELTYTT